MIKKLVNDALRSFGYEINSLAHKPVSANGFLQYKYVKPDGTFDYDQYREVQAAKNRRDIDRIWVSEANIDFLSHYIKKHLGTPKFGLCHGTKRGVEQEWFISRLGCKVLGTEISDTAEQFPNTIRWDFHEVKPEWIGAADFIYSNALDHSYDPQKCINAWMSCVRPGGFAFIEWHTYSEGLSLTDPFSSDIVQLVYAITKWGEGRYCVRELIPTPANPQYISFVVLYKF